MDIILTENKKAYIYSGYFLIATGLLIWFNSVLSNQSTSIFLGASFTVLSSICLLFIYKNQLYISKMLWGILTPILIIAAPVYSVVEKSSTLLTYGYALIGASLFVINSFNLPNEKKSMWLCIIVFFTSILFYDKIIIMNSVPTLNYSIILDNYLHFKIFQLFHFISLVYLMLLIKNNKVDIETKLINQVQQLKTFTQNILTLSKNKNVYSEIISEAFKEITTFVIENIDASRISIWEYNETIKGIECIVCYDSTKKAYTKEGNLLAEKYPTYFKHLLKKELLLSYEAETNEITKEFASDYLIPNNIKAMMDIPFFIDGQFKGILCFEDQTGTVKWNEIDILFAQTIAMYTSIVYYCIYRKKQTYSLEDLTTQLQNQNTLLRTINEKIVSENNTLLTDLDWKNKNIAEIKSFIDNLSFKNSHDLRGPLSRILGLLQLYYTDTTTSNKELYIEYISKSAKEMDQIIRGITAEINSRNG
ncbi:histidine kinase dimerization/phospho-acceptor domain-containing protein [uncultured Cytophaga sp.]|uniref:histidine kinase dimerization/phospho-acceptor domain-containing protein n=1 Tax=uncultured Cytophaga sp. TaxID=160238 RepID=UPI00261DCE35|nr:histidine kinase dimerization/phospho-acceptor domain-containing protein [uncultured Cytophaga sp.]